EVAAQRVLGLRPEHVVGEHAAMLVRMLGVGLAREVGAEGGDLHGLRAAQHVHDLEAPADDARTAEGRTHFLRRGAGSDVEVLGLAAEEEVAHGAPDHERSMPRALQLLARAPRAAADVLAPDLVLVRPVDRRPRILVGRAARTAEELVDVFLDHCVRHPREDGDPWIPASAGTTSSWFSSSEITGHPSASALARSVASGSTATGCVTRSRSGRSFSESL